MRCDLLAHDRQLGQAGAAAAVLLGDVDADVPVTPEVPPELLGRAPLLGFAGVGLRAEALGDLPDRPADGEVLLRDIELHQTPFVGVLPVAPRSSPATSAGSSGATS